MERRFENRREEVLADCQVPPALFDGVMERLVKFAAPYVERLCCWRRPDIGPLRRPDDRLAGSGRWRPDVLSIRHSRKIFCRFLDRIAELDIIMEAAPSLHAREQLRLPAGNWNGVWRPGQHPRPGLLRSDPRRLT